MHTCAFIHELTEFSILYEGYQDCFGVFTRMKITGRDLQYFIAYYTGFMNSNFYDIYLDYNLI